MTTAERELLPKTASVVVDGDQEHAVETVAEVARLWGGEWQRTGTAGVLEIPVAAGVRRGIVKADLSFSKAGGATQVSASEREAEYRLQSKEIMVLLLGAAGGLFLVVAPFVPELFDLIPMAGLMLLLAWFLVVSRLRNRSLDDFLAEVEKWREPEDEDLEASP